MSLAHLKPVPHCRRRVRSLSPCLSASLSLCLCLSVSLCICLCLYVPVSLCVSASLSLYLCLSVSLCICLCLSVHLSLSLCACVSLCLCLSVSLSQLISQRFVHSTYDFFRDAKHGRSTEPQAFLPEPAESVLSCSPAGCNSFKTLQIKFCGTEEHLSLSIGIDSERRTTARSTRRGEARRASRSANHQRS